MPAFPKELSKPPTMRGPSPTHGLSTILSPAQGGDLAGSSIISILMLVQTLRVCCFSSSLPWLYLETGR